MFKQWEDDWQKTKMYLLYTAIGIVTLIVLYFGIKGLHSRSQSRQIAALQNAVTQAEAKLAAKGVVSLSGGGLSSGSSGSSGSSRSSRSFTLPSGLQGQLI